MSNKVIARWILRWIAIGIAVILLCNCIAVVGVWAEDVPEIVSQVNTDVSAQIVNAKSGILIEASTGQVLYEVNADEKLPIASVTKTMTMLLIMEALDSGKISLEDMVSTSEYASSMGGSQVFLEPGEQMSVHDMLKAIAVASGNDAAVAMAEFIGGTEPAFVEMMNKRANEIGAVNTHFINCNGLNETSEHYSTARDVAIISAELLKHPKIQEYTTIWMDTLRNGEFGLSNTNKLIRFYDGANGIKTGSTSIAKYCLSAAAKRDNMQLIAVVLAAPSTADRFGSATKLLDYGFANYALVDESICTEPMPEVKIVGGCEENLTLETKGTLNFVVKKGNQNKVKQEFICEPQVNAPVEQGQKIGEIHFKIDDELVAVKELVAKESVDRIGMWKMFVKVMQNWITV